MTSPDSSAEVILYTRRGCHLCDIAKQTLARARRSIDFGLQEVDVDTDPELLRQFNDEVPVVFINGRKAFKYRVDEQEFLRVLRART